MPTVHLLIKGKVQGVFYRASAKEMADDFALKGWIKNTNEGDVEAVVSGDEKQLKSFIEWCWKGPRRAEVKDVMVTQKEEIRFENFSVIR